MIHFAIELWAIGKIIGFAIAVLSVGLCAVMILCQLIIAWCKK